MSDDATIRVYEALLGRELADEDLSARRISRFLGKTTGALYHHFGSLDGFLFAVSQHGYVELRRRLEAAFARRGDVADVAQAFVEFGLDHPELYPLMFERRFDWDALRAAGAFDRPIPSGALWDVMERVLGEAGAREPGTDGRLLWAGLHGLVSLAASGRANVRALTRSDRDVACAAARELARRLVTEEERR